MSNHEFTNKGTLSWWLIYRNSRNGGAHFVDAGFQPVYWALESRFQSENAQIRAVWACVSVWNAYSCDGNDLHTHSRRQAVNILLPCTQCLHLILSHALHKIDQETGLTQTLWPQNHHLPHPQHHPHHHDSIQRRLPTNHLDQTTSRTQINKKLKWHWLWWRIRPNAHESHGRTVWILDEGYQEYS